jgi:hypothetical protein
MLSVVRCGFARLQMKVGHMDGMHCIIDGTSILVKIKSVASYNCQTVWISIVSIIYGRQILLDYNLRASFYVYSKRMPIFWLCDLTLYRKLPHKSLRR